MQKLEKILAEIDIKIAGSMGKKREGLLEAREIIRKHMDDGWIPVEERLPEDDGVYLCSLEHCMYDDTPDVAIRRFEYGAWCSERRVIAWQPLPEPYYPERSTDHERQ